MHDGNAFFGSLRYAIRGDGQTENSSAVFFCQRQEFGNPFRFIADGVNEGTAGIGFESGLQSLGVAGIDGQRCVCKLGNFSNGLLHGGGLVNAANTHIYIKEVGAGFDLIDGLFFYT
jgi:hypothetical protein